jgi:hypothetical protein
MGKIELILLLGSGFFFFILSIRAVYFLISKKDPIQAINPKLISKANSIKHWYYTRQDAENIRKEIEERG